jgi:hypothetical protein
MRIKSIWKKLEYAIDSTLVITTTLSAIALVLLAFFVIITVIKSLFG